MKSEQQKALEQNLREINAAIKVNTRLRTGVYNQMIGVAKKIELSGNATSDESLSLEQLNSQYKKLENEYSNRADEQEKLLRKKNKIIRELEEWKD